MEVFDLIRTGDMLQSVQHSCIAIVVISAFFVIMFFAVFMATLDDPSVNDLHHKIITRVLIVTIICLVLSIICVNVIPSPSGYYAEAKFKLYQLQNINDKQVSELSKYLEYKINETK